MKAQASKVSIPRPGQTVPEVVVVMRVAPKSPKMRVDKVLPQTSRLLTLGCSQDHINEDDDTLHARGCGCLVRAPNRRMYIR